MERKKSGVIYNLVLSLVSIKGLVFLRCLQKERERKREASVPFADSSLTCGVRWGWVGWVGC